MNLGQYKEALVFNVLDVDLTREEDEDAVLDSKIQQVKGEHPQV